MLPRLLAQLDPTRLNTYDWHNSSLILHFLSYNLLTVIVFATLMLFAHAVIPSALASGHVPEGLREPLRKARFPMYVAAVLCVFLVAIWLGGATHYGYNIAHFYSRWWI